MEHLLNTLLPHTTLLLSVSIFWYATIRFTLDRARTNWRQKVLEEAKRRESAEEANKAKATFLTSMSHEVRAPLNAIVGFTDLALKTPLNPELRDYLETVRASADWLSHVANEILDFARMEAASVDLSEDVFSLREILKSAVNIADPLAEQRKLALRLHLDAALPARVRGDSTRLLQVVFNLIENGVKFTTAGSILVTAVLESRTIETATIRIAVADTGIGIAPERIHSLFEPLTKADHSLDRRSRSCGFGLSICQRIVQLMGGKIEVQSRPGIGSTFAFSLTLPTATRESENKPADPHAPQRRLHVLVADDNAASRMLATVLLQGAGHRVTEASTGLEALKLFTAGAFDLILMDLEMPELNGVEATKAIRATESGAHITPIYALTAHAADTDQERCTAAGMTGFLSKPLAVDSLLKLASAIGQGQIPTPAAHP